MQFGTLQITPRVCLTRPQTEAPLTEGFVEVDEIDNGKIDNGKIDSAKTAKRIFSGWMFAASPGLHGVEHPVYDVWLKDCKGGVDVTASPVNAQPDASKPAPPNAAPPPKEGAAAAKPRRTIEPQEPVEPSMDNLPPSDVDAPPPAGPDMQDRPPGAPDNSLGAPIEVGPPPGAPRSQAAPGAAPAAPADQGLGGAPVDVAPPPAAPKPPKKRKPPVDPNAQNGLLPPADIPRPAAAVRAAAPAAAVGAAGPDQEPAILPLRLCLRFSR